MKDEKEMVHLLEQMNQNLEKLINQFELNLKIQFCSAFLIDRPAWLRQFPSEFVDLHNELRLELVQEFLDLFQIELED